MRTPQAAMTALAVLLALGTAASGRSADAPRPAAAPTVEQWRADLQFLARELPKRHPDPWRSTPKADFDAAVAALDARLPELDADQAYVGLDQIARMMGDAHTFVSFPDDLADLPLRIGRFGDDFRVASADRAYGEAVGARVLEIDGQPIAKAYARLLTLTPGDENPPLREALATGLLHVGTALHGLGITHDRGRARFTLEQDDGRRLNVDVSATAPGAKPDWVQAARSLPLSRTHPDETFWCEALAGAHAVYCDFRTYAQLGKHAAEMFALIDKTHPDKLVIDMRANGGGDYFVGLHNIVDPIARRADLNRKGHLFVLIGPSTASAAMSNAAHFRYRTAALLVGREIGEKPNSWQEARQVKLPGSGLELRYATQWYAFVPKDVENAIRPDHEVVTSWADYLAGRDPALDWVLAYPAT